MTAILKKYVNQDIIVQEMGLRQNVPWVVMGKRKECIMKTPPVCFVLKGHSRQSRAKRIVRALVRLESLEMSGAARPKPRRVSNAL